MHFSRNIKKRLRQVTSPSVFQPSALQNFSLVFIANTNHPLDVAIVAGTIFDTHLLREDLSGDAHHLEVALNWLQPSSDGSSRPCAKTPYPSSISSSVPRRFPSRFSMTHHERAPLSPHPRSHRHPLLNLLTTKIPPTVPNAIAFLQHPEVSITSSFLPWVPSLACMLHPSPASRPPRLAPAAQDRRRRRLRRGRELQQIPSRFLPLRR